MKMDLHRVLIRPLLTEKVTAMRESANTVGFWSILRRIACRSNNRSRHFEGQSRACERPECARQDQAPRTIFWTALRLEESLREAEAGREARALRKCIRGC